MTRAEKLWLTLVLIGAGALLFGGWRLFWFLTDDAFIAFRYVSNGILGHGYVWNAEPFRPVEGYTSFLWVAMLDLAWRLLDVEPPQIANNLALLFAFLTLLLGAAMLLRLRWRPELRRHRILFIALVLLAVTTNRTFLAWSSSGFETAMFNFFLVAWIYAALFGDLERARGVFTLTLAATCTTLTRPDGLLYAAATLLIVGLRLAARPSARLGMLLASAPLAGIPAHIVWRRATYGEWLPNTYYAKFVGFWPESGLRYALSFIVEYALWVVPLLLLVVGIQQRAAVPAEQRLSSARSEPGVDVLVRWIGIATVVLHVLYYTLAIGGDHFEYRPYSHLLLLLFVCFVWLLNRSRLGPGAATAAAALFVLLSWPVPWSHWWVTRNLDTRDQTRRMRVAIAPSWPTPVRAYARVFDELQEWLISHWVCVRHQEHKINQHYLTTLYPTRAEGAKIGGDTLPVHAFQAVGVAAWSLPHVHIIDLLGLNDYVIARNAVDPRRFRGMAHEREAPAGYVDCFAPNVFLGAAGSVRVAERDTPLTAEQIRECEKGWAQRIRDPARE
ncbi:MAG: hypothetical protein JSW67_12750 [Candidatus Latescibacterota bacterium]|nr:MAG: hypothetical protein JSW67_12750 [Candidatus Latescibacterota bacterium]